MNLTVIRRYIRSPLALRVAAYTPPPLVKPRQNTKPLREFQDPAEIAERLLVLRQKLERIRLYDDSVRAGKADLDLLDLKQQQILRWYHAEGKPFPARVRRDLGKTIDTLYRRHRNAERRAA